MVAFRRNLEQAFRETRRRVKAACEIIHWCDGHCNIRRLSYIFWSDREYYVFPDSAGSAAETDRFER